MAHFEYKCQQPYFDAVCCGDKTFEVRKDDREEKPQAGDTVELREWNAEGGYTGNAVGYEITYALRDPEFVKPGHVILALNNQREEHYP